MRVYGLALLLWIVGGCGGGGGGSPQLAGVDFGLVAADHPTFRQVKFANPLAESSTVEAVAETGPFRAADGELPAFAPGGLDLTLQIRFDPPAPGDYEGSVSVRFVPSGGGNPKVVEVTLAATAEAARPQILTKSLDFGEVLVTESATRRMTILNASGHTGCQVAAPPPHAGFSFPGTFFPLHVAAQETVTLDVEYAPVSLGIPSFDLVFPHDGAGGPLTIPVSATTTTWPEDMIVDLGDVVLDANGDTPWLEVEATPHTISVTMEATATTAETIECTAVEWPTGYAPSMPPWGLQWPTVKKGIRSVTIPWTDASWEQLAPGGGTYRFRFRREAGSASTLKVRAILENRVGGVVSGGVVDLNVFLAPAFGLTPESAKTNPNLQATLAGASTVLSTAGLSIGNVTYYALGNPDYDVIGTAGDPNTEVFVLLAESAAATDTRVNVFYVTSLSGALGVSGMVQGPAANGWPESGVIINGFDAGKVTAHEIGHYLGLHHYEADAITDTGPSTTGNVMGISVAGTTFTPGQGHVMLRHPLVRSP
jgi:hypothetical protein